MMNMPNINPQQILQRALQQHPEMANNPQIQQYIQVLMSGDSQRGEKLAQNLCNSMQMKPDQLVQQAQQYVQKTFFQRR